MTEPEFSRTVRTDTIGATPRSMHLEANEGERAALARRFGLAALDRLEAEISLSRPNREIVAGGRIAAEVTQSCVVTDADVPGAIDEAFAVRFRTGGEARGGEEEVELGEEELDVVFFDGATIDVGEVVAQTLALNLDPYPRAPEAAEALREAGVIDEAAAGPFGALAGLKDKLRR